MPLDQEYLAYRGQDFEALQDKREFEEAERQDRLANMARLANRVEQQVDLPDQITEPSVAPPPPSVAPSEENVGTLSLSSPGSTPEDVPDIPDMDAPGTPPAEQTDAAVEQFLFQAGRAKNVAGAVGQWGAALPKNFSGATLKMSENILDSTVGTLIGPNNWQAGKDFLNEAVPGLAEANAAVAELVKPEGTADAVTREFLQFFTPFMGQLKVYTGMMKFSERGAGLWNKAKGAVEKAIPAIAAEVNTMVLAMDPNMERFSDIMKMAGVENEWIDYIASDGGSDAENRLKNAMDAAVGGAVVVPMFWAARAMWRVWHTKPQVMEVSERAMTNPREVVETRDSLTTKEGVLFDMRELNADAALSRRELSELKDPLDKADPDADLVYSIEELTPNSVYVGEGDFATHITKIRQSRGDGSLKLVDAKVHTSREGAEEFIEGLRVANPEKGVHERRVLFDEREVLGLKTAQDIADEASPLIRQTSAQAQPEQLESGFPLAGGSEEVFAGLADEPLERVEPVKRGFKPGGEFDFTPKRGEPFTVMRVGAGADTLTNKNAGDPTGIAEYLVRMDDFERPQTLSGGMSETISVFDVATPHQLDEPFKRFNAGSTTDDLLDEQGKPIVTKGIGMSTGPGGASYSFQKGSEFSQVKVGEISIESVRRELARLTEGNPNTFGSTQSFAMAGTALTEQALRNTVERFRAASAMTSSIADEIKRTKRIAGEFGIDAPRQLLPDNHPLLRETEFLPDREGLHQTIRDNHMKGRTAHPDVIAGKRKPIVYVMGGGGASGKGTIKKFLVKSGLLPNKDVAVHLDPDDIKFEIPEMRQIIDAGDARAASIVHEESSDLVKEMTGMLANKNTSLEQKADIVLDVTMGNPSKGLEKINELKEGGYDVVMIGVTTDFTPALERAVVRAGKIGRWVRIRDLAQAHKGFSEAWDESVYLKEGLLDDYFLYDTSGPGTSFKLIDSKESGVIDPDAVQRFLEKRNINAEATTIEGLE